MPDWLAILLVLLAVAFGLNPGREDLRWFFSLRRPRWLTFERWIPLIWLAIYGCFYASALLAWRAGAGGPVMGLYLLLLVLVQSYTLVIGLTRRLRNGSLVGALGWGVGVALAIPVASLSLPAALLLLPYLLWSPVGTFVTWRMQRLNR
ncbi:MAG: tryptophan-rich sensory protein [Cyanobacteriota bacterium]|jgi:translocator protein|nr:tryptophan-rich sensory protein [Cyanobacteriota bacterium]